MLAQLLLLDNFYGTGHLGPPVLPNHHLAKRAGAKLFTNRVVLAKALNLLKLLLLLECEEMFRLSISLYPGRSPMMVHDTLNSCGVKFQRHITISAWLVLLNVSFSRFRTNIPAAYIAHIFLSFLLEEFY